MPTFATDPPGLFGFPRTSSDTEGTFLEGPGLFPRIPGESQIMKAERVQSATLGFVPAASWIRLSEARATPEDLVLIGLAVAPFLPKGVGTAFSSTFRVTIPGTARNVAALKTAYAVVKKGTTRPARTWTVIRWGQLFGDGGRNLALRLFANPGWGAFDRTAPKWMRVMVGIRIVALERTVTTFARSVPTQANVAIHALWKLSPWGDFPLPTVDVRLFVRDVLVPEPYRPLFDLAWAQLPSDETTITDGGDGGGVPKKKKGARFRAATEAAKREGWKPFTKMTAAQRRAFKSALKGSSTPSSSGRTVRGSISSARGPLFEPTSMAWLDMEDVETNYAEQER